MCKYLLRSLEREVGGQRKIYNDRSIIRPQSPRSQIHSFHQMGPPARGRTLTIVRVWTLPTTHTFLAVASCLGGDRQVPTARGAGWGSLRVECGHRWPQPCEGGPECHSSKGRPLVRRNPPPHGSGEFLSLVTRYSSFTHIRDTMANEQGYVDLGLLILR